MARAQKDLLSKLADAGETAIHRLTDTPGADRFMGALTAMKDRMDEMQKKIRGLDELERRVAAIERKLDMQTRRPGSSPAKRKTAAASRKTSSSGSKTKSSSSRRKT
jgi:hypothetical protein